MESGGSGAAMAVAEEATSAEALASGLRALRSKGLLCDAVLAVGGERFCAHQAVLAAASQPLRKWLLEGSHAEAGELLAAPPRAAELRLEGVSKPEAARAVLAHAYGAYGASGASDVAEGDLQSLEGALGLPGLREAGSAALHGPEAIASGLRALRSEGLLCDIILTAGGARFAAHQAVLAAASEPLCRYILNGLAEVEGQGAAPGGEQPAEVASRPLELELQSVTSTEAVQILLDYVYGGPSAVTHYSPTSEAANRDVLRLAVGFGLPRLRERAAERFVRGLTAAGASERLAVCDELGLPALREHILKTVGPPLDVRPKDDLARQVDGTGAGSSTADSPPKPEQVATELERSLLAMVVVRFSCAGVPSVLPAGTAAEETAVETGQRSRQDAKALKQLREAFEQRPVWLQGPLEKQLPAGVGYEKLMRLLPIVAYQWSDGPWSSAYTRLGWDPRENAAEAKLLQVLAFRDPYFRGAGQGASKRGQDAAEGDGGKEAGDFQFKRPPASRTQMYQLVDIKDDFVQELIDGCDPEPACCKRNGWLSQFVLDASRDRLAVKSHQMREKQATKDAAAAGKRKGAGRAARPATKRARIGGA